MVADIRQSKSSGSSARLIGWLAEGKPVVEVAKSLEVSEHTYSRWRYQFGGMKADEAKELRQRRDESRRLRHLVADLTLDNQMLEEIARGKF